MAYSKELRWAIILIPILSKSIKNSQIYSLKLRAQLLNSSTVRTSCWSPSRSSRLLIRLAASLEQRTSVALRPERERECVCVETLVCWSPCIRLSLTFGEVRLEHPAVQPVLLDEFLHLLVVVPTPRRIVGPDQLVAGEGISTCRNQKVMVVFFFFFFL